jgi:DNA-directed RNA polymerase subunit RPC12/RpoP
MENPRTIDPERGQRDVICARCGREAEWMFLDTEHTQVEVTCPDCGKFEMLRTEFDQAESEIVEPAERE